MNKSNKIQAFATSKTEKKAQDIETDGPVVQWDNASDYGSELLGSTLGWLTLALFLRLRQSPQQTAGKIAFHSACVCCYCCSSVCFFVFYRCFVALFLTAT